MEGESVDNIQIFLFENVVSLYEKSSASTCSVDNFDLAKRFDTFESILSNFTVAFRGIDVIRVNIVLRCNSSDFLVGYFGNGVICNELSEIRRWSDVCVTSATIIRDDA